MDVLNSHGLRLALNSPCSSLSGCANSSTRCTTIKWADLIVADKIDGYVSGLQNPSLLALTLNAANLYINAVLYSLSWIIWFNSSMQNDKHVRCNLLAREAGPSPPASLSVSVLLLSSSLECPAWLTCDLAATIICCNAWSCLWLTCTLGSSMHGLVSCVRKTLLTAVNAGLAWQYRLCSGTALTGGGRCGALLSELLRIST
jgi:hypothetical protein